MFMFNGITLNRLYVYYTIKTTMGVMVDVYIMLSFIYEC